jgi:hypothetical protein
MRDPRLIMCSGRTIACARLNAHESTLSAGAPVSLIRLAADPRRHSARVTLTIQAMIKSGTISVPFVSGPNARANAKLNAPTQVPTIIGMAKPNS